MNLKRRKSRETPPASPEPALKALPTADADLSEMAWRHACFYSSPIGKKDSEQRKHADGLLKELVQPAIEALDPKMGVTRADRLPSSPITADIFKHVFRSRLLIADLSFHRPNVLHEVGLRHATGKPCVLISRKEDSIPSNLKDVRVVFIDTSQVWDFVSDIDARRTELTEYARWALSTEGRMSSPIHQFLPDYRKYID
jgi:hypothetical protein